MSARSRHGIGTAQKSALSDNEEEESAEDDAVPGNKNARKVSQKSPENTKQGTSTPSTNDHAKTENVEKEKENIKPTVSDFSKQGQWPGYLTTSIMILLGIMLYHVLFIQSLGTISEENVGTIIKKMYGPKFEEMLKKEIDKFRTSHLNNLSSVTKELEDRAKKMEENQRHLFSVTKELEGKAKIIVQKIHSKLKGLKTRLNQVKSGIKGAEENIKTFKDEAIRIIIGNFTQVKSSIEHLDKALGALNESHSAISYRLEETKISSNQLITDQQKIKHDNDVQTKNYVSLQENIENTINYLNNQLDTANKNFTNLNTSIADANSRLQHNQHLTDDVGSLKTTLSEKVEPNLFNKGYFLVAFMILFVLVLITLILQYRLYQRMEGADSVQGGRSRKEPIRFQSSTDILSKVPSKPQLQAAVCIISFDEGRQAAHQQLLDSANLPNCRVVTFVVGRHANIPDLPRCKVYLMCTEFSERHVIIEEQGLGLGDLHRTTYDAVLKLGGQLIILYTRDPGSRRLKDDEVFNKNIYCVTHQEELVELNNLGRFFSVYDTLTAQQKTKLRKTIMDCLQ